MDGDIVRWVAIGLDKKGRLIGLLPIKLTGSASEVRKSVRLDEALLTLKERTLTSVPLAGSGSHPGVKRKWEIADYHRHFQSKMRDHFGGYPGLSAKDTINWKQLIDGFGHDVLLAMIDGFVGNHANLTRALPSVPPDAPTVGILRGWGAPISAFVLGKHAGGNRSVREFAGPKRQSQGKF